MSSESDIDEFYDAQDVTPLRQSRLHSKSSTSEGEFLLDLEKEEIRLLEQKRSIEDRRKQEEEDIQQKLASLDRKKQKELERKEAAKKAYENELRRKKLEGMRMYMSEESTPGRPPSKIDSELHEGVAGDVGAGGDGLAEDQLIADKLEALSFELEQSGRLNRGDFAKVCDKSYQGLTRYDTFGSDPFSSVNSSRYPGLDRTIPSFESDLFEDAMDVPRSSSASSYDSPSIGSNLNTSGQAIQKLHYKQIDDLVEADDPKQKSSSLPPELSVYPCEAVEMDLVKSTKLQEPDIIQSTKSLPRHQQPVTSTPKVNQPQYVVTMRENLPSLRDIPSTVTEEDGQPVAPPRRKKSVRSGTSPRSSQDMDQLSTGSSQSGDGDRLSVNSIGSYSPSNPLSGHRPSLDLSAATQGNRHVVATEDTAVKGENESQEPVVTMETVTEEVTPEASSDCDLDVVVLREDSIPCEVDENDENLHNLEKELEERDAKKQRDMYLMKQKSKTLGITTSMAGGSEDIKRARLNVGRVMSDKEILEGVMVTNLDTGEKITLGEAEDKMPANMNPLSLHIMRLTKEYSSEPKIKDGAEKEGRDQGKTVNTVKVPKKRGKKIKKFLSKSVRKIKSELKSMKEDKNSSSDEDELIDGRRMIKIKASHSHKGPYDFDLLVPVQNLTEDSGGAVWTMKFSHCGKLLATGGQDNLLKIWVLKSGYTYFDGMRQKYSEAARVSPTPSQDSMQSIDPGDKGEDDSCDNLDEEEDNHAPFMRKPFCVYRGHTADLLDVSWSKNYFILSSSMDKTVRLWHVSRKECLCCFQHIDFVTAIAFHPKDDRYFLSGSLDGKLRLWSIPEKKVALWNEVSGQSKLITAANFCSDGKIAVGTYDGRCVLYTADHLDYHTQIHVRSTRGKNAKGGKITGVEPYPGENKILVTSNDSRIRLYDLRDKTLTCKYKGPANNSSRIKASFNQDGRYIICGSEDGCVYIWRTQHDFYKFYSVRRDRNDFWEGVKAHIAVVTAAIFAPEPSLIIRPQFKFMDADDQEMTAGVRGEVIISADFNGAMKVFINKFKPGSG